MDASVIVWTADIQRASDQQLHLGVGVCVCVTSIMQKDYINIQEGHKVKKG